MKPWPRSTIALHKFRIDGSGMGYVLLIFNPDHRPGKREPKTQKSQLQPDVSGGGGILERAASFEPRSVRIYSSLLSLCFYVKNTLNGLPPSARVRLKWGPKWGPDMARNKLKALEVKKGDGKLFDGAGQYLQKRSVESGRWVYRYKHHGRSREMGLGPFPTVSLADARKERDQWEAVLKSGEDPTRPVWCASTNTSRSSPLLSLIIM